MPKFAANLTMLFNEVPFLDRFEAAAKAGFKAVEYLFPYQYKPEELAERLQKHGLQQVLFNLPAGDWAAGDRGLACLPARVNEFRDGIARAIEYARALKCPQVNCLAGVLTPDTDASRGRGMLVENLKYAAEQLAIHNIRLLIEPVNTIDIPGFFLHRSSQAKAIMDAAGSDNLFLQYDVYHMQVMEGDLARTIENNLGIIRHIQIADNPGRHEPGTGEINYPFIFRKLDELGYGGWVSGEYRPATTTEAGLGWVRPYL